MSQDLALILDTVERLFRDCPQAPDPQGGFDTALWNQAVEMGLPALMVGEGAGGLGLKWEQVGEVLRVLGAQAVALPLAETLLAAHFHAANGHAVPEGVLTIAPRAEGSLSGKTFSGRLSGVAFGRHAQAIVAQMSGALIAVRTADARCCREGLNLAREPRDAFDFEQAPVLVLNAHAGESLLLAGALMRSCQSAGALQAALSQSIGYARERKQFGRFIGQFQAVQQALAQFGSEAAAVNCAARAACRAMDAGEAAFAVGAAKLRANLAIALATSTAHQVHGAIGFTDEYVLRRWTQRLWSWRSEFGNDRWWSERLGAEVAARGAENFWSELTARDDAAARIA